MDLNVDLWLPANPAVVAVFVGAAAVWVLYRGWKFVVSSVTGTG